MNMKQVLSKFLKSMIFIFTMFLGIVIFLTKNNQTVEAYTTGTYTVYAVDNAEGQAGNVYIRGWAYRKTSREQCLRFDYYVYDENDTFVTAGNATKVSRTDVQNLHNTTTDMVGFEVNIWLASGPYKVNLYAVIVDNSQSEAIVSRNFTVTDIPITFDKQNGTGGTDSKNATYALPLQSITVPTRTNYIFDGYYTEENGAGDKIYNSDGSSNVETFKIKSSAVTLYANWIKVIADQPSYTNDYTVAVDSSLTSVTYKWYRQESGETAELISEATSASFPTGLTLTEEVYYCEIYISETKVATSDSFSSIKVIFDGNNGSGTAPSNQYRLYTDAYRSVSLPATNPFTREGYTSEGWGTDKNSTSGNTSTIYNINNGEESSTNVVTIYAIWKEKSYVDDIVVTLDSSFRIDYGTTPEEIKNALSITTGENIVIDGVANFFYTEGEELVSSIVSPGTYSIGFAIKTTVNGTWFKMVSGDDYSYYGNFTLVNVTSSSAEVCQNVNYIEYSYNGTGSQYAKNVYLFVSFSVTLTGKTITYEDNFDDIVITVPSDTNIYIEGEPVTVSSTTLTRNGYSFLGWNTDKDATVPLTFNEGKYTMGSSNATLYAIWEELIYSSNINITISNFTYGKTPSDMTLSAEGVTIEILSFKYSETLGWGSTTTSIAEPGYYIVDLAISKSNYHFEYNNKIATNIYDYKGSISIVDSYSNAFTIWDNYVSNVKSYDSSFTSTTNPEQNTYIVAKAYINLEGHSLIYDDNVNEEVITVPTDENKYLEGEQITISSDTLSRVGYTFAGWSETSDGQASSTIYMGSSNKTIYAIWDAIEHNCNEVTYDKPLNSSFKGGLLTTGNYYLAEDITLTSKIIIENTETVKICLNDKVLNLNKFHIFNVGVLTIDDCGTTIRYFTDEVNINYDSSANTYTSEEGIDGAYETYLGNTSETANALAVTGGVITNGWGSKKDSLKDSFGGAIENNSTLVVNSGNFIGNLSNNGTITNMINFTMNGGKIIGNRNSNLGKISNNSYISRSAAVGNDGTFTMNGGEISYNTGNFGGAIENTPSGTVTINNGTISYNQAIVYFANNIKYGGIGGAIHNKNIVNIINGNISYNTASYGGGAIYNSFSINQGNTLYGTITIDGGTFSNNSASYGGAIYNDSATFTINDGTFSYNSTDDDNLGGAIYSDKGTITINNGTFSNNSSTYGGAIATEGGTLTITGGLITQNTGVWGAAINIYETNTTITGGSIIGNTVTLDDATYGDDYCGAGIDFYDGSGNLTIGGNVVIKDNLSNGEQDNIGIENFNQDVTFSISSTTPLTTGAYIGLRLVNNVGTFVSGTKSTDYMQYFHSDNENYYLKIRELDTDPITYNYNIEEKYTVTYSAPTKTSGEVPTNANKYFKDDTFVVASQNDILRTGYNFLGWNDGTNDYYQDDVYTVGTNNIILSAVWEENCHSEDLTVIIDSSLKYTYGTTSDDIKNKTSISTTGFAIDGLVITDDNGIVSSLATPGDYLIVIGLKTTDGKWLKATQNGYYAGNVTVNGVDATIGVICSNIDYVQMATDDNCEFYEKIKFFIGYEVTIEGNSLIYDDNVSDESVENLPSNEHYLENQPITELSNIIPTRNGYLFKGWSETENGTIINETIYMGTSKTIYAIWDISIDKIEFTNAPSKYYVKDYGTDDATNTLIGNFTLKDNAMYTFYQYKVIESSEGVFEAVVVLRPNTGYAFNESVLTTSSITINETAISSLFTIDEEPGKVKNAISNFENNYGFTGLQSTDFYLYYRVVQESITITETTQEYTYGDSNIQFNILGTSLTGFTVQYYIDDEWSNDEPINAGTYKVKVTRPQGDYAAFDKEITSGILINHYVVSEIDIELVEDDFTYDGNDQINNLVAKYKNINGDKITLKVTNCYPSNINYATPKFIYAGEYIVTFKLVTDNELNNYRLVYDDDEGKYYSSTYNMKQKEIGISWTNTAFTYDGSSHKPTATATGVISGDMVELSVSGDQTNVGTSYTATASFTTEQTNYVLPSDATKTFSITQATTTITGLAISDWTYGGTVSTPSANTNFGTIEYTYSDTEDGTYGSTVPTNAGTHYVKASVKGTTNYTSADAKISFTINKAKVTVPTANTGLTYNGTTQTGVTLPDNAKYTLTNNTGTSATSYTATASLSDKTNYEWNLVTATSDDQTINWSIAKLDVTITANNQTITYGGSIAKGTDQVSVATLANGDTLNSISLTTTDTNATTSGTIIVTNAVIKDGDTDVTANYIVSYTNGVLTINKLKVNEPKVDGTYTYSGENQTVSFTGKENYMITLSNLTRVDAGTYFVIFELDENHEWNDTSDGTVAWLINKLKVNEPTAIGNYTYTGSAQTFVALGAEYYMSTEDILEGTNAGIYTFTYTLDNNHEWNENSDGKVTWTINKAKVNEPRVIETYTYNGNVQRANVIGVESYMFTTSSLKQTNAGSYSITYTLDNNHEWNDNSDGIVNWSISKAKVSEPIVTGSYTYLGRAQKVALEGLENYMTTVDSLKQTNVGTYTIHYTLDNNHEWDNCDGIITWNINKAKVNEPSVVGTYEYNGFEQNVVLMGVESYMTTTDSLNQINAGTYSITYTLDNNHEWNDNNDGKLKWTINKAKANEPSVIGSYSYNGEMQKVYVTGVKNYMTTTDSLTQTNVGTYTITYTLDNNYEWNDNNDGIITWTINKEKVDEPKVIGNYIYTGKKLTVKLTGVKDYMTTSDKLTQTKVGIYQITYALDNNHEWNDNSDGIINWEIKKSEINNDEDNTQAIIESSNGFDSTITVEVDTITKDYNISDEAVKLSDNEKVGVVYDVKLIRTIDNVKSEIQLSDINESSITIKLAIPSNIDSSKITRILYVDSNGDIKSIDFDINSLDEDGYYELKVNKLTEFAFICEKYTMPVWLIIAIALLALLLIFIGLFFIWKHEYDKAKKEDELENRKLKIFDIIYKPINKIIFEREESKETN